MKRPAASATSRCSAASRRRSRRSTQVSSATRWKMTERVIPDAAQREQALDPADSFIVQAPAGSGKTELLIQRYLVLLARVERPEEITAITFTRKAAAEMRKRILEVLRLARREPRPAAPYRARTWELGRAVLERSDALGWAIEQGASRLRVQTIDALCA